MNRNEKRDCSVCVFRVSLTLIIAGILYYKPSAFLFLPILVSVFVMFLQSRVSRYAFLAGAINSILYAIAYTMQTQYSTALYAFLVSFPLQFLTFLSWSKKTTDNKTELRQMSTKVRISVFGGMAVLWGLLLVIFSVLNSRYLLMDNAITVVGNVSTILCALRFKEYVFTQLLSGAIMVCTYVLMIREDPSAVIWVISNANSLICTALAWFNMKDNVK